MKDNGNFNGGEKTISQKWYPWMVFTAFAAAYAVRIIKPELYMAGVDMPAHVLASLRLGQTRLFETRELFYNFFAQLFQYNHGYTTIFVPHVVYRIFFELFRVPVTETTLTLVNSLFGLASLGGIYYFVRTLFGKRTAFFSLLIIAFIPLHIGMSRVHIGQQMMQTTFFYLSLGFLYKTVKEGRPVQRVFYFICTFFYIGADNAFFLGLFLHLVFLYFISLEREIEWFTDLFRGFPAFWASFKKVYLHVFSLVFILLPIGIYIAVTAVLIRLDVHIGYLLKLFEKTSSLRSEIKVVEWVVNVFQLAGPVTLLFLASFIKWKRIRKQKVNFYFYIVILMYFLISVIGTGSVHRTYLIYLEIPLIIAACYVFANSNIILPAAAVVTLVYSLSVIYSVNIGIETTKTYGSVVHYRDRGLKTLGYLLRTEEIEVSMSYPKMIGTTRDTAGLFIDAKGLWYYLGYDYHRDLKKDILNDEHQQYDRYIVGYRVGEGSENNRFAAAFIEEKGLYRIADITVDGKTEIELYSNTSDGGPNEYKAETYNPRFREEFHTPRALSRVWLGQF